MWNQIRKFTNRSTCWIILDWKIFRVTTTDNTLTICLDCSVRNSTAKIERPRHPKKVSGTIANLTEVKCAHEWNIFYAMLILRDVNVTYLNLCQWHGDWRKSTFSEDFISVFPFFVERILFRLPREYLVMHSTVAVNRKLMPTKKKRFTSFVKSELKHDGLLPPPPPPDALSFIVNSQCTGLSWWLVLKI